MSLIPWFVFRSIGFGMNTHCATVNKTFAQKYLNEGRIYSEYFQNRDTKHSVCAERLLSCDLECENFDNVTTCFHPQDIALCVSSPDSYLCDWTGTICHQQLRYYVFAVLWISSPAFEGNLHDWHEGKYHNAFHHLFINLLSWMIWLSLKSHTLGQVRGPLHSRSSITNHLAAPSSNIRKIVITFFSPKCESVFLSKILYSTKPAFSTRRKIIHRKSSDVFWKVVPDAFSKSPAVHIKPSSACCLG